MKLIKRFVLKALVLVMLLFASFILGAIGIIGFINDKEKKNYGFAREYVRSVSRTFGL